jgi:hypothetical protein
MAIARLFLFGWSETLLPFEDFTDYLLAFELGGLVFFVGTSRLLSLSWLPNWIGWPEPPEL